MPQRAFVIRGFETKKDRSGQEFDMERVDRELIAPALATCGLAGNTTAEVVEAGNIRADMFALILEADLVLCDITVHNANVFYELGVRHALRKKHTVLIKGDPSADTTPFDLSTDRYLKYPAADPASALDKLVAVIQATLRTDRETDSPIFLMLPRMPEADPSEIRVVPLDLLQEVKRAEAMKDKGWLRVIAQDLAGQRYQWDALRVVARAQWSLKDTDAARASWETVRSAVPGDAEAQLALASIYERLYRGSKRESLLEASNQALEGVLAVPRLTPAQRADALGQKGRNIKTRWRLGLAAAADAAAAQQAALTPLALDSYRAYREAMECDLNAFYPSLAALQMGHVLLALAALPGWRLLFKGDRVRAAREKEDLEAGVGALAQLVAAAINRARLYPERDADAVWVDVAEADLMLLDTPEEELAAEPQLLVQAYRNAVPDGKRFAWDASSGQLQLFVQLGIRAAAAQAVLDAFGDSKPKPPEHLVVFTGHSIDAPGAARRFPAAAEPRAKEAIRQRLLALKGGLKEREKLIVLASAAPGADILLHELCLDLDITSRLCLALPADAIAAAAFSAADQWRSRFRAIVQRHDATLLQLSDDAQLPRWLQGRAIDPWERGNRWVMQLAQSWGAQRVTLLALWNGEDDGHDGGTAQMVRMAKAFGLFELEVIDSRAWLD